MNGNNILMEICNGNSLFGITRITSHSFSTLLQNEDFLFWLSIETCSGRGGISKKIIRCFSSF